MNKIAWVICGVGILLMITAKDDVNIISIIGLVLFLLGVIPCVLQLIDKDRQNDINAINDRLYALGYSDSEVKERQAELKSYSKAELASLKKQTEMKLEEQKKDAFFEPLDRK